MARVANGCRPVLQWCASVVGEPSAVHDGFSEPLFFEAGAGPRSIVATDLDGDGVVDLAVASSESNLVSSRLGACTARMGCRSGT